MDFALTDEQELILATVRISPTASCFPTKTTWSGSDKSPPKWRSG